MKKITFILAIGLSSIISNNLICQNQALTVHLNAMMQVAPESESSYRMEISQVDAFTFVGITYDYMDKVKVKGTYIKLGKSFQEDGYFTYYHPNGRIESQGEFDKGVKVGMWKRFDINGKPKTERLYPAESADKIRSVMELDKVEEKK